ncbi:porin family protein [Desulfogranum japonicum]|uniref:porin family protein n=1 Tax=Desulfogranum japonicum TaxID=231447 RepID=UPI001E47B1A0|nr:porin family protein [Desulfogranum japonicum]
MKKLLLIAMIGMYIFAGNAWAGEHRLGFGINYWTTLDDIDVDDVDEDGFSYIPSYQYWWSEYLGVEANLEILPDWFDETAYAPQAYILFGKAIYVGAGIGMVYYDGDFNDEPFFALRAGLNLEVLPNTYLDISANYRFNDDTDLKDSDKDIDTDTVFLGAAVRFAF